MIVLMIEFVLKCNVFVNDDVVFVICGYLFSNNFIELLLMVEIVLINNIMNGMVFYNF